MNITLYISNHSTMKFDEKINRIRKTYLMSISGKSILESGTFYLPEK